MYVLTHICEHARALVMAHLGQLLLVVLHNNIQPMPLEPIRIIVFEDHGGPPLMWLFLLFVFWSVCTMRLSATIVCQKNIDLPFR